MHLRETVGTAAAAAAVEILSLLPPLGLTVAVLGPGARLPSALPLHLREWRCRLEVGAIIVLVLARASPHHVSYAYARHPQTIGWGHRRGAHQQFRTHELERLVNRPREGCSRIAGTVGPQADDGEEDEGHVQAHPFAVDGCDGS